MFDREFSNKNRIEYKKKRQTNENKTVNLTICGLVIKEKINLKANKQYRKNSKWYTVLYIIRFGPYNCILNYQVDEFIYYLYILLLYVDNDDDRIE